ncbi:MAG: hypothetical protein ACYDBQ_07735 [Thermoplasmatota archaeon]
MAHTQMMVLELNRKQTYGERDFPLKSLTAKVTLGVEMADLHVPLPAARRMALQQIQKILAETDEDEFLALSAADITLHTPSEHPSTNGNGHSGWTKPADLDLRIVKSAHRIVLEVAKRGESGRAVMASELVGEMGLSAPTVGRLLRPGDPGHSYLNRFIRITPDGRTKSLDLTSEGRILASRIRAGVVPS